MPEPPGPSALAPARTPRPARIVLAPIGSRGDVQPLLALAVGLRDRGHAVTLAGPANLWFLRRNEIQIPMQGRAAR